MGFADTVLKSVYTSRTSQTVSTNPCKTREFGGPYAQCTISRFLLPSPPPRTCFCHFLFAPFCLGEEKRIKSKQQTKNEAEQRSGPSKQEGSLVSLRLAPRELPVKEPLTQKVEKNNKESLRRRHGHLAEENTNAEFPLFGLADAFLKSANASFMLRTVSANRRKTTEFGGPRGHTKISCSHVTFNHLLLDFAGSLSHPPFVGNRNAIKLNQKSVWRRRIPLLTPLSLTSRFAN